jgi:hypothetical protein
MIDQLALLRDLLEDAVADSDCVVNRVAITAGRPAAPSAEDADCRTAIFVFGAEASDLNQNDPSACIVDSRWAMQYEIWTCYPEAWGDVGDEAHEAAAACLYELMRLAWCALVEAKDDGYFCDCKFVELAPLIVQQRSGGAVSALGGVTLPYVCPVETSPSSP